MSNESLFMFHYGVLGNVAPAQPKEAEKLGPQMSSYFPITTPPERKEHRYVCGPQADSATGSSGPRGSDPQQNSHRLREEAGAKSETGNVRDILSMLFFWSTPQGLVLLLLSLLWVGSPDVSPPKIWKTYIGFSSHFLPAPMLPSWRTIHPFILMVSPYKPHWEQWIPCFIPFMLGHSWLEQG